MNIKTITCHDVCNYGASLQAFALQTYLESLGHDVQIIDYKPEYQAAYNIWKVKRYGKIGKLSKYLHIAYLYLVLRKYLKIRKTKKRIGAFASFKKEYLKCTNTYNSYESLATNPPSADVYIAGSDQIWRTNLNNGTDPAFYLQFGDNNVKRLSYAASFGTPQITGGLERFVCTMAGSLDAVSVREKSAKEILSSLGVASTLVCDPVFLLSAEEWKQKLSIQAPIYDKAYLLVYDLFHSNKKMEEFCLNYAKEHKVQIIAINDKSTTPYADVNINDGSPVDFVNLIANAQFVVADSFHATAFSTVFHRPFRIYFINHAIARLQDFLETIGLPQCLNAELETAIQYDWAIVQERIDKLIACSRDYLSKNI